MKAGIYIYIIVLAAGMVTVLAQEIKTNTQTSTPNAGEVAVPPSTTTTSAPAPAVVKEARPPVAAPQTPTKAVAPLSMTATSAPAPAVAKEVKSPVAAPLVETSAVPAQPEITAEPLTPTNAAAPPIESSGTGHKGIWTGAVIVLAVVGGRAIFMWRRSHISSRGSLITSALNEDQKSREDKNAPPPMT
jgi:hypothetical protein